MLNVILSLHCLSIRRYARSQVLFANTLFQCIAFHPEEFHIITGGSDRKIAYWESYDGSQIRELEASKSGPLNGLDVDPEGKRFVTGSADKLVKVSIAESVLFFF
jgi:WD40 repeat protein